MVTFSKRQLHVEGFTESRGAAIRAVEKCSESEWLKTALLGVILQNQPFCIIFDFDTETEMWSLADRLRLLGFQCATDPKWPVEINAP